LQSQFNCLVLKIKKGIIQDATFIHPYPGHAKTDKPRENETKKGTAENPLYIKNIKCLGRAILES
jgi:IS5 family transposase